MMGQTLLEQGIAKARQKDYQGAIAIFSELIQNHPYLAEAYYRRGLAKAKLGNLHDSVFDHTEAIGRDRERAEYYYARAFVRVELKNFPGAIEDLEVSIRLDGNYAPAYQLKGIVEQKLAHKQAAIDNFKKAAELYLLQKDSESCRDCIQRIEQLRFSAITPADSTPQQISIPFSVNKTYAQILEKAEKGDSLGAIKELDWALQLDSQDGIAYCCRGIVKSKMGDFKGAIGDLNQALQIDPQNAIAYRQRGKLRYQFSDIMGALADFDAALGIDDRDDIAYVGRGNVRMAMGNYQNALEDFDRAIELNSDNPKAYLSRAQAYSHQEELGKAIADWQTAASQFFVKEDWQNYQKALNNSQKFSSSGFRHNLFNSSNFYFLDNLDIKLFNLAKIAEQNYAKSPMNCLVNLKQFGELLARSVISYLRLYPIPEESQQELLNRLYYMGYLSDNIYQMFQQIQQIGDRAIRYHIGDSKTSLQYLQYARELSVWYYRNFGGDPDFVPEPFVPPTDL
jgi:tetratricopeptide (TPR) repeat protein